MKRLLCVILLISFVFAICITPISALDDLSDDIDDNKNETLQTETLYFSCTYDDKTKKINITGNIMHDAFAKYKDHSLVIYAISPEKNNTDITADKDTAPILNDAAISLNFNFSFPAKTLEQRYSKYAIFLKSPEGKLISAAEPRYADIKLEEPHSEYKNYFKGISTSDKSAPSELDVATAIIPVYLDKLYSSSSNVYIYQCEDKHLFFNKAYIDELDSRVNSAAISGARVYLQFLLQNGSSFEKYSDEGNTSTYVMPDVYNLNTIMLLHSATDFLTTRYSLKTKFGIILGKSFDERSQYNYCGNIPYDKYVERCAFYAIIVSGAARCSNADTEIILPFSGHNFTDPNFKGQTIPEISVNNIVNDILGCLNRNLFESIYCSLLIETASTPLNITNDSVSENIDLTSKPSALAAGNLSAFSTFFRDLTLKYNDLLGEYIFLWTPVPELTGNALSAAYAYSYYTLLKDNNVSSFIVDFSENSNNIQNMDDLKHIIKYIDTSINPPVTNNLLKYFDNAKSWTELIGIAESTIKNENKDLNTVTPYFNTQEGFIGSFSYFDFSSSISIHEWVKGANCQNIKIDFSSNNQKALKADFSLSGTKKSELLYAYEHHENMSFTPFLDFSLKVEDNNVDALYNVIIVVENPSERYEASCVLKGNTPTNINLDFSKFKNFSTVGNIKIFINSLNGDVDKASLWIYEITGYSKTKTTEELKKLIDSERDKIYDSYHNEYDEISYNNIIISIVVIIVSTAIVIIFVINLKRTNKGSTGDDDYTDTDGE